MSWKSVYKELPKIGEVVLCCTELSEYGRESRIHIGRFSGRYTISMLDDAFDNDISAWPIFTYADNKYEINLGVRYWMPLPKEPENEQ